MRSSYRGITTNNLKSIDFSMEPNTITLIKGCNGSGKSSLAVDTVFKISDDELSQITSRPTSPSSYSLLDYDGILPAICLHQENFNTNPRSTIGSYFQQTQYLFNIFSRGCQVPKESLNFNNPDNYCERCRGLGCVLQPSIFDSVDFNVPLNRHPFRPWNKKDSQFLNGLLLAFCQSEGIPTDKTISDLSDGCRKELLNGTSKQKISFSYRSAGVLHKRKCAFIGIVPYLENVISEGAVPSSLSQFYVQATCPSCKGSRLSPQIGEYKVCGMTLSEFLCEEFAALRLSLKDCILRTRDSSLRGELLKLAPFLDATIHLQLGHLCYNRSIPSLSGGELQRLCMAKASTSHFKGFLYVFDEPTSMLHPAEWDSVIAGIKTIKANGNTILIVDHSSRIEPIADQIVCLGPGAGNSGGRIIPHYANTYQQVRDKFRGQFIPAKSSINIPFAQANNVIVQNENFPTGSLVGICGVSGSGKTSFAERILCHFLPNCIFIGQDPIRGNSYSIIASFLDVLKDIEAFWAASTKTQASSFNFYRPGRGQCSVCAGTGRVMEKSTHYVTDILCPACHGARYSRNALRTKMDGMSIYEFLNQPIDDMLQMVPSESRIHKKLRFASSLGLGYLKLFQKTETLSGGEAQRLKLASQITEKQRVSSVVLDEPFRGVDAMNASRLMTFLFDEVRKGVSTFLIEHNPEVLSCCSYLIEFGPGSGSQGGNIVFNGIRTDVASCPNSKIKKFI